jgi:hypothetical protein
VIDPATGALSFQDASVQIGSALKRSEFLSAWWSKDAVDWVVNEPWHSWKLPRECTSDSISFIVVLYYRGEQLMQVELCNCDPKFGTSWNDHSDEKELNRKASHDQWLLACLRDRRTFSWGSVWSGYDDGGGSSSIRIRYEHH